MVLLLTIFDIAYSWKQYFRVRDIGLSSWCEFLLRWYYRNSCCSCWFTLGTFGDFL